MECLELVAPDNPLLLDIEDSESVEAMEEFEDDEEAAPWYTFSLEVADAAEDGL